jgi:hypothetical protein
MPCPPQALRRLARCSPTVITAGAMVIGPTRWRC